MEAASLGSMLLLSGVLSMSMMKILSLITQEPVSEGPVPWVSKSNVTFVAEQVSHHPPSKLTVTWLTETATVKSESGLNLGFTFSL